jgi:hypothetical protein
MNRRFDLDRQIRIQTKDLLSSKGRCRKRLNLSRADVAQQRFGFLTLFLSLP